MIFTYGALTLFGRPFQDRSVNHDNLFPLFGYPNIAIRNPSSIHCKQHTKLVWALPSSLAATKGMRNDQMSDRLNVWPSHSLEHFIAFFSSAYWNVLLQRVYSRLTARQCVLRKGVSPFGHLRIKGCSTPPRSLSQSHHVLHRLSKPRHPPYALIYPPKFLRSNSAREYLVHKRIETLGQN